METARDQRPLSAAAGPARLPASKARRPTPANNGSAPASLESLQALAGRSAHVQRLSALQRAADRSGANKTAGSTLLPKRPAGPAIVQRQIGGTATVGRIVISATGNRWRIEDVDQPMEGPVTYHVTQVSGRPTLWNPRTVSGDDPTWHLAPQATATMHKRKQAEPQQSPASARKTEVLVDPTGPNMRKVYAFLQSFDSPVSATFKTRKKGQRIEVNSSGSETLAMLLDERSGKKKGARTYIDPSYHETVQYIDIEFGDFYALAEDDLTPNEIRIAYDILMSRQVATAGPSNITASGPSPLTAATPTLLHMYHDLHYKEELKKKDETASTRHYEAGYQGEVNKRLPFSHWRPFALPMGTSGEETSMVSAVGGTLDMQTPTSGFTIGQGKVYSAIYKHFQRSMELLNQALDIEHGEYDPKADKAFETRTKQQSEAMEGAYLGGLFRNEEENFATESGFDSWDELRKTIENLLILIAHSLDQVPDNPDKDFHPLLSLAEFGGSEAAIVKQIELTGTILGLMIKKEKRLVLNYSMLGKDKPVKEALHNIYQLHRLEEKVNQELDRQKDVFGPMMRRNQERRTIGKELKDLTY